MKRVFVSQPMLGKTNEYILEQREKIARLAKEKWGDIEIVDSFFKDAPHEAAPLWFLGKSLEAMSTSDVVVACCGYSKARGCMVEVIAANEYNIPIYIERGDSLAPFKKAREACYG